MLLGGNLNSPASVTGAERVGGKIRARVHPMTMQHYGQGENPSSDHRTPPFGVAHAPATVPPASRLPLKMRRECCPLSTGLEQIARAGRRHVAPSLTQPQRLHSMQPDQPLAVVWNRFVSSDDRRI